MPAQTVFSVLEQTAARYGELAALHQGDRTITWNEYRRAVAEVAAGLRSLGLGKGDIVALASDVRAEFYLADIGVMANGSIAAAFYISYPPTELVRTLRACLARAVFAENPAMLSALAGQPEYPTGIPAILLTGSADGALTFDELRARGRAALDRDLRLPEVSGDDYAILYLTSGAMGEPKMGLVTHRALVSNVELGPKAFPMGPDDAMLAFLSPAHVMQRLVAELLPLYTGIPVYFVESLLKLPDEFRRVKPTIFLAPPRLWERVHASIRTEVRRRGRWVEAAFNRALAIGIEASRLAREGRRLPAGKRLLLAAADRVFFRKMRARFGGRMRVCASGSAPLGIDLAEFFLGIGMPLIEGYGLTEGGVVMLNPPGQMKPGSIGKPLPGVEIRLGDDGELLVRSPTLFAGYFSDPAATAEVLRGGWLHTGDLAEIDADGSVTITGRKKEVIVASSGRKIYPGRIEALFGLEPIVSHVVLIGEGRPHIGALITLNTAVAESLPGMNGRRGRTAKELEQAPPVAAALREAVRRVNSRLADYEQIRKYRVLDRDFSIDAGELTATLKVRRARALENFSEAVEGLYATQRD